MRLLDVNQPNYLGIRPNSNYGAIDSLSPVSASVYHALQTTVRMREWHGLSGFAGYTWSKSLDDASDGIDFNFTTVAFPRIRITPVGIGELPTSIHGTGLQRPSTTSCPTSWGRTGWPLGGN